MTIDVSNNNPRIEYTVGQGVVQTVFTVPFDFFEDSDVKVYVDGSLKSLGSDYNLTGGDGSTGTITFVTATPPAVQQVTGATGGSTVVVARHIALDRVTDFIASQDINRAALNTQLDTLVGQIADLDDKVDRTLHISDYEVAPSLALPSIDNRKGRVIAFHSTTGAVEAGPLSSDINAIANNLSEILAADDNAAAAAASATASANSATASATSATASATSATASAASATASAASAVDATTNGAAQVALAETQANNSATSATASATSATASSTSATASAASATAAESSKTSAESAQSSVAANATAAESAKIAAQASQSAAATSETNAATSATNSANSATSSAASAVTATSKATSAEYWAQRAAGWSAQTESQTYDISSNTDFGLITDVGSSPFSNESNLSQLTMSKGSLTYNYGVI